MSIDAQHVADELVRTIPVFREEAARAMREAVDLTVARERELAPGKIGESVRGVVRENQTGVSGTIRPRSPIAGLVDHGTGLLQDSGYHHPITAKTPGKKLRWVGSDGEVHYRLEVKGQRPQHFIEATRGETALEAEELLAAGAARATERLFR